MTFIQTPAPWDTKAFTEVTYVQLYHKGESNHCPGCGGTHWLVGRSSAECARCDTALPLAEVAYRAPEAEHKPALLAIFDRIIAGKGTGL